MEVYRENITKAVTIIFGSDELAIQFIRKVEQKILVD